MSRYDWPGSAESEDDAGGRHRHNAARRRHGPGPSDGVAGGAGIGGPAAPAAAPAPAGAPVPHAAPGTGPHADEALWLPMGPSAMLSGQPDFGPRVAGRVRDIQIAPDGSRAYCATAGGGVWFLDLNGPEQWLSLNTWTAPAAADQGGFTADPLAIGCLLVQWDTPSAGKDTIFAGTGELQPYSLGTPGGKFGGVGVLFAVDPVNEVRLDFRASPWKREGTNLVHTGIFRLAQNPVMPNELVAATSDGLYRRFGAPAEEQPWERITADPFGFDPKSDRGVTDVIWSKAKDPDIPVRLWVALRDNASWFISDTGVYVSEDGAHGPYDKVSLSGRDADSRLTLADSDSNPDVVYALGSGPRLWRIDEKSATKVDHVPDSLFGKEHDQSSYDQAVAVHPDNDGQVVLGGSFTPQGPKADPSNAALYRSSLSGSAATTWDFGFVNKAAPATDPTWIGEGVHPDVHVVRYARIGGHVEMWVGCDGGVYRSRLGGEDLSFVSVNTGLSNLQVGYLVSHPDSDVMVLTGTQDNGTQIRTGDTVWCLSDWGDGGGLVLSPTARAGSPDLFHQYTKASWSASGAGQGPVYRNAVATDSEKDESKRSSFYSSPGATQRSGGAAGSRLGVGTNRLWMSDNWGGSWVTLPSNTDPRGGADPDDDKDVPFGSDESQVLVVRWQHDGSVYLLFAQSLLQYRTDHPASNNPWTTREITRHRTSCGSFSDNDITDHMDFVPDLGIYTDIALEDQPSTPPANRTDALYLATTGSFSKPNMDTLWYFDGGSKWHRTHLRPQGTRAPAYAALVDPDSHDTVYVGTAVGVFKGVRGGLPLEPTWNWTPMLNGLPEAPVQDLSLYRSAGPPPIRLLRAAIEARGVWEVDLDNAAQPTTYLRVHRYDSRRVLPTTLTYPHPNRFDVQDRDGFIGDAVWFHSPDVVLRPAPRSTAPANPVGPPPAVAGRPEDVWTFLTALHRVDPAVRAVASSPHATTGGDAQVRAAIHRYRANPANALPAGNTADQATWASVVTAARAYTDPWSFPNNEGEPTEADLEELVHSFGTNAGGADAFPAGLAKIDVLVHHRHPVPLDPVQVSVLLLRVDVPDHLEATWAAVAVPQAVKDASVSRLTGGNAAFAAPWTLADAGAPVRQPSGPLSAGQPRAVTFRTDLGGDAGNDMLFVAIVSTAVAPIVAADLAGANLRDLVLGSRRVAVRAAHVR